MNMRPSPRRHDGGASTQKHVYPVTRPNPPMCKVAAVCCDILPGCPLLRGLLLRGW
jgi:hypothetical protein